MKKKKLNSKILIGKLKNNPKIYQEQIVETITRIFLRISIGWMVEANGALVIAGSYLNLKSCSLYCAIYQQRLVARNPSNYLHHYLQCGVTAINKIRNSRRSFATSYKKIILVAKSACFMIFFSCKIFWKWKWWEGGSLETIFRMT